MATTQQYTEGIGRRKRAVARVRIMSENNGSFVINQDKDIKTYFPDAPLQLIVREALEKVKKENDFSVSVHVTGGGIRAQAEAIRLGIARALIKYDKELRGQLKKEGFLKRDARVKERKKFGLKKARKSPQWSKR